MLTHPIASVFSADKLLVAFAVWEDMPPESFFLGVADSADVHL